MKLEINGIEINYFINYSFDREDLIVVVFKIEQDSEIFIFGYGHEGGGQKADYFAKVFQISNTDESQIIAYITPLHDMWERKFIDYEEIENLQPEDFSDLDIKIHKVFLDALEKIATQDEDQENYILNQDIIDQLDENGNLFSEDFDEEEVDFVSNHWGIKYKWEL